MRYAIITNPVSGKMSLEQKRFALAKPAGILGAQIYGLHTTNPDQLARVARDIAANFDVLVVAGGDGTFSLIINAVDTERHPVAFLPLGTGNAMRHALHYTGSLADMAIRIKKGEIHELDLISCGDRKRAFMASIGIEGSIIRLRDRYLAKGATGFRAYFLAAFHAYFREYGRVNAEVTVDGVTTRVKNLLSLIVVKQPYYGYGMRVVPEARFGDRRLHILWINYGLLLFLFGAATSFTVGNRTGRYLTGRHLSVALERPRLLQTDGDPAWESDAFTFSVLPNALKIKH